MSTEHITAAPTISTTATAPSSANPSTAAAIASTSSFTTATKLNSMEDLKKRAPKVYQQMMQGIGMQMCYQIKHQQDRLTNLIKEYRDQS